MVEEFHNHAPRRVKLLCEDLTKAGDDILGYIGYVVEKCQDRASPLQELIKYFELICNQNDVEASSSVENDLNYILHI